MKTDILRRKARFVREVVFAPFKSHINKTLNNCGWLIAYGSKEEELYDLYKDIDKWERLAGFYSQYKEDNNVDCRTAFMLFSSAVPIFLRCMAATDCLDKSCGGRLKYCSDWLVKNSNQLRNLVFEKNKNQAKANIL